MQLRATSLSAGSSAIGAKQSSIARMVSALRRLGGSLWMVDNAFSGSFIDNVGTTPVTAVADLVGLIADKSYGGELGVELLSPVWTSPSAGVTQSGNNLIFTAAPAGLTSQGNKTVGNKTYALRITVDSISGGALRLIVSGGQGTTTITTPGTYTAVVKASNIDGPCVSVTSGTVTAVVSSTSVRELTGNHATQSAVASKPSVQRVNGRTVINFDGSNDFLQTGITTGNEGWVCAGVTSNSYAVTKTIFWTGANDPSEAGATLRVLGGGVVQMVTCDGTAQAASSGGANAATGTPQVIEGGWNATTLRAAVDGAEATAPNTRGGASTQTAKIGDAASGQWFNGHMHAIAYAPVLPSAADRATIRNGIAALQGRTL